MSHHILLIEIRKWIKIKEVKLIFFSIIYKTKKQCSYLWHTKAVKIV